METFLQIIGGLLLLGLGGEALVRGAVGAARRLGVSEVMIGLTFVGFGTSSPELITSVDAALLGSPGIALGNVVGSNISNVLLIFGLIAVVRPVTVIRSAVMRDGSVMLAASLLLVAVGIFVGDLARWVGVLFVVALAAYITYAWCRERTDGAEARLHEQESEFYDPVPVTLWKALLMTVAGLALLMLGADLLVNGAIALARLAGLSETIIGLTIVAVGTSLPELVASLTAALRGRGGVAFGNIVGSNIYNVLGILGVTAIITPFTFPSDIVWRDWLAFLGSAGLLVFHALTGQRVTRWEGGSLLAGYVLYLGLLAAAGT